MILLFKWLHSYAHLPAWALALLAIVLWGLLCWLLLKLGLSLKIRPGRVVILAQRVIFLAGAIFIFNVVFAPVVLIALHGLALYTLGICAFAAILYFLRVTDQAKSEKHRYTGYSPPNAKDDDIFR